MPKDSTRSRTLPSIINTPLKLREVVLAATVLFYVAGFAITNLHLGSLGIVAFDVVRAKYIVTGLLFGSFVALATFLIYGLIRLYDRHDAQADETSTARLIRDAIFYSFTRLVGLRVVVGFMGLLAGPTGYPASGIPLISPASPFAEWLSAVPTVLVSAARTGAFFVLFMVIMTLALCFVVFIVYPKRKEWLREIFTLSSLKKIATPFLVLFLLIIALILFSSAVRFLVEISVGSQGGWPGSSWEIEPGFDRFFWALSALYLLSAALITFWWYTRSTAPADDSDPTKPVFSSLFMIAWVGGIVLPLYCRGVYPAIPQQVGGGRPLSVQVTPVSDEVAQLVPPSANVYLIDRTSDRSFFVVADGQRQRVIAVANSEIRSITYAVFTPDTTGPRP